jgi:hypothetical protein
MEDVEDIVSENGKITEKSEVAASYHSSLKS